MQSDDERSEIWNSKLVQSIRSNHASLSSIWEYEENQSLNDHSDVDKEDLFNI
jgi:hypothetical protein